MHCLKSTVLGPTSARRLRRKRASVNPAVAGLGRGQPWRRDLGAGHSLHDPEEWADPASPPCNIG